MSQRRKRFEIRQGWKVTGERCTGGSNGDGVLAGLLCAWTLEPREAGAAYNLWTPEGALKGKEKSAIQSSPGHRWQEA